MAVAVARSDKRGLLLGLLLLQLLQWVRLESCMLAAVRYASCKLAEAIEEPVVRAGSSRAQATASEMSAGIDDHGQARLNQVRVAPTSGMSNRINPQAAESSQEATWS
jgi:hypothetical protein